MGEVSYIGYGALQEKAMAALTTGVTQGAEYLAGQQQAAAPFRTGTLAASIHVTDIRVGALSVTARTEAGGEASDYAVPQHEGSRPHWILPVTAEALFWGGGSWDGDISEGADGPVAGADHPVAGVLHPGNPATKYMARPLLESRELLTEFLARAARAAF